MQNTKYRAALYLRLSKDDGRAESSSIESQRVLLQRYAAEHGYAITREYIDDGWSGTSFDRPAFRRMIADIEAGRINMVLIKDLSRLGRDYIMAGQYTELYFPSKGVRCIAVNDGYDSDEPYSDIVPFKNVINEMYARDISRKIRSALTAQMHSGACIAAFAPYGYRKDPEDKHRLLPDAQAGAVVQEIFRMAAEGIPPAGIAAALNRQAIPSPMAYRHLQRDSSGTASHPHVWTGATVAKMLRNAVYLGHSIQGKTAKPSFKSIAAVQKPRETWITVEHTHEALISLETFNLVQRRILARTPKQTDGFQNIFSGIAYCADCGHRMSSTGTRKKDSPADLVCGAYKQHGSSACSSHRIDYRALQSIVLTALREQLQIQKEQQQQIIDGALQRTNDAAAAQDSVPALFETQRRIAMLDEIIAKLYEDHAAGRLDEARLHRLLQTYTRQSEALEREAQRLAAQSAEPGSKPDRARLETLFLQLIQPKSLTPALLFRLIDRIEIGQGHYEKGEHGRAKHQSVKVFYRFQTKATVKEYIM